LPLAEIRRSGRHCRLRRERPDWDGWERRKAASRFYDQVSAFNGHACVGTTPRPVPPRKTRRVVMVRLLCSRAALWPF